MTDHELITITVMSGPKDGLQLSFPTPPLGHENVLTLGRSEESNIILDEDNLVSRMHARLICTQQADTILDTSVDDLPQLRFQLEDIGSRNGTFIGEERIPQAVPHQLQPGELFRIGKTWLRVDPPGI